MFTEEKIRALADNAVLLLISRAVAPVCVVALTALGAWLVMIDREVAANARAREDHGARIASIELLQVERYSVLARLDERSLAASLADARQELMITRVEDRLDALTRRPN